MSPIKNPDLRRNSRGKLWKVLSLLLLAALALGAALVLLVPSLNALAQYEYNKVYTDIKYALNPPEEAIFVPQVTFDAAVATSVRATLLAQQQPTATATPPQPTATSEGPTATLAPTQPPTPTTTPLPASVILKGVIHEYQGWNNCGPATLAMALSYWKWQGDQRDTAAWLKPNPRDKNVMPYEMKSYVESQTDLKALVRMGGTLDVLKGLVAAGFPVVVEKGFDVPDEGWMGHYNVITGYDDAKARFITQDSYISDNLPVSYDDMQKNWIAFNYIFLVIYPPERESEVLSILGPLADETAAYQIAAQRASDEIFSKTDPRDQYFAWYNRGTSLVYLQDFAGAAEAYDQANLLYPSIKEGTRPWRMLWYQTGPYFAYFYTGRYYDVTTLATHTLDIMSEPVLEESYYWRAKAEAALGATGDAIADLKLALKYHEGFQPALDELALLGEQ